jgi:hypothetical protein
MPAGGPPPPGPIGRTPIGGGIAPIGGIGAGRFVGTTPPGPGGAGAGRGWGDELFLIKKNLLIEFCDAFNNFQFKSWPLARQFLKSRFLDFAPTRDWVHSTRFSEFNL